MGGRKQIPMENERVGRLLVVSHGGTYNKQSVWNCLCDCGKEVVISGGSLRSGRSKSCGCLAKEKVTKHGMWKSPTYTSWRKMKNRCNDKNFHQYNDYGGRGISYTDEWESFENFYRDMGDRPEGTTLNRLNNNLSYSKENCNWADKSEQNYNKGSSKNKSGKIGVHWDKKSSKWEAMLTFRGEKILLGKFKNIEDAILVRKEAELKYHGFNKE